jgi:protein-tyrosine phosphatase
VPEANQRSRSATESTPGSSTTSDVEVVFVCWGNICRSPMAERVAEKRAADAGLTGVRFTSAATSSEELGAPMDPRAAKVLKRHGYRSDLHTAHRISAAEIRGADLVVAMEDIHVTKMMGVVPEAANVVLLTDFDPDAEPGSGVPDPWYGKASGFEETLRTIEAAMPGVLDRVRELQAARNGS